MRGARVLTAAVSHKVRHYCSSAGRGRGRGRGTTAASASSLPSPAVPPQPQPSAPGSAPASSVSVSKGRGRGDSPIIAARNAAIGAQAGSGSAPVVSSSAAKATSAASKANATSNAAKSTTTTPAKANATSNAAKSATTTPAKVNATSNAVKSTTTTPAATTNAAAKSPAGTTTTTASAGSKAASTTSASPTTTKAKKVAAAAGTKTASVAVAGDQQGSAAFATQPATTTAQESVASSQQIANVGAQATTGAQATARGEASEAFAALIQSCAARGLIHEIDYVYGAMQAAQVSPTLQTCQTLLESYIQVGNVQKMDAMYAEMREARMGHQKPEATLQGKTQASEILTALINSWFGRGFLQEVDFAYRGMKACQLPVSLHTYRAMMEAYNLLGNYEAMDAVYKEMRASMAPPQPVTGATPGYGAGHGVPLQPPTVYREQQQHIGQAHPSGHYPPPMQMQQAATFGYPPQQFQPVQQWPQPPQATYYAAPHTNPYMQQGVPPPAYAYHPQSQAYQPVYPGYQAGYQPGYPGAVQYQPPQPSYAPPTNVIVPPVRPPPQPAASVAPRPPPQPAASVAPRPPPQPAASVAPRPPPQPAASVAPRPPQRAKLELQPKALELLQKSEYNELLKGAADRASIMKPQIPATVTSQVPMRPQSVSEVPVHHPYTAPRVQQPPIHSQVQHPQVQRPTMPQAQPGVHPSMVSQYVPAGYAPPTFQPVPAGTGIQYAPAHYAPSTVHVTPLPTPAPTGRPPFHAQSVPHTGQVAQGAAMPPTPTILQRPPIAPPQVTPTAARPQMTVKTSAGAPAAEKAQAKVSPQQPKVTPQLTDVKSPEVADAKAKLTQISKPQLEVKDAATAKHAVESERESATSVKQVQADKESHADINQVDVKPASLKLDLKAKTDAKPKTLEVAASEEPVVKPSLKLSSVGRGKAAVAEDKSPDLPKPPSLRLDLKKQTESPKQVEQPGSPKEVKQLGSPEQMEESSFSKQVEQSTASEAESPRAEGVSEAESEEEKPLPSLRKLIGRGRGKGGPTMDPVATLIGLHTPSDAVLQQDGLEEQDENSANLPALPFESRRGKGRGKVIDLNAAAEEEKRRKLKMEEAAARAIAILESGLGKSQMSAYLERRKKRVSEFSLIGGFAGRATETRMRKGKDPRQKAVQGEIDLDGAIEYIAPQEYMSRGDVLTEVEEAIKGTIHRHFMLDMDPEAAMEEFGTNPDIDDKPKPTLDETLDKAKEVLMAQDGIDEKEWEEAVTDVKKRAPQIKSLVERYTGPKKQSAKQNNKELHEIVSKLPPFASPELAASAKRVMMTLQDNPGWSHGDKRRLLTRLVKDVEKLGEAGAAS